MSIKGTSVEVIVVLVVFPPLLYMRDQNIYLSPLTGGIEKSIGMTGGVEERTFISSFIRDGLGKRRVVVKVMSQKYFI